MHKRESSLLRGKVIAGFQVRPAHLIAAAILLHLALTLTIFLIGRCALLPNVFDPSGVGIFFATDSFAYRVESITMADILRGEGIIAWLKTPAPFHVRAYSLCFAIFGPLFGFNILSAEPLNLLCYLALLVLVFMLGREVFDRRVGWLAVGIAALWPSLLLHTTQLLRDPLFIPLALALVLVCVSWLTRNYSRRQGLAIGFACGMLAVPLWILRTNMWEVFPVIVLLGVVLFIARQIHERRIMKGNLICVVLVLVLVAYVPRFVPRPVDYMTRADGTPLVGPQNLPPAALGAVVPPLTYDRPTTFWSRLLVRLRHARLGFTGQFPNAGSNIDTDVQFNSFGDVIRYLPRALAIGLFAPFPNMWFAPGKRVGLSGRLLSGIETLTMCVVELLALVCLWQSRRRLSAWLLMSIVVVCVTAIGLVVVNVATVYRTRYMFWILLMILGARGAMEIPAMLSSKKRPDTSVSSHGCGASESEGIG
jgi:hypothetical protein